MITFGLVHGSIHGGWCWKRVAPLLRTAGHDVYTPILTGLGEREHLAHPGIDLDTHIRDLLGVLEFEDLHDVVLVGHSYGTMVITGVADRVPERISHLVYLDGAMACDDQTVLDLFPPEWRVSRRAQVDAEGDGWRLLPPADLSVWGINQDDEAWVRAKLTPQPFKTFTQPLRLMNAAGFGGPKTFIACLQAPPAQWRDAMIDRVRAEHDWRYRELTTGHDAMITAPGALTRLLLEITETIS
jgi:pimeloyl-ACP methyl ester carboxylesterase